ncbi:MAG: AMP-binding protein [Gammaproteobacteria bacterium]|nr:AMP-binding protein [Gammaproteobacteria bacterium]
MTKSATKPLLARALDDYIASTPQRSDSGANHYQTVRVSEFLAQTNTLANELPDGSYAINLCGNRYRFLVAFVAIIIRGQCNLLPANKNKATQSNLAQRYQSSYIIHDGAEIAPGIPVFEFDNIHHGDANRTTIPEIPMDQLCAISFTSGSTGQSKANLKTWHTLYHGMDVNARYYLDNKTTAQSLLATVPSQHMYGLESSIMLPMYANVCVIGSQPLFPQDICDTLAEMPAPRILVTTPVHLRALGESKLELPQIDLLLSATAPLDPDMARRMEAKFECPLREIYGCSEAGSIARRQVTQDPEWEAFDVFRFRNSDSQVLLDADHLPEQIPLQDVLEFSSAHRFHLLGRHEDMINIAGKRGSLAELNRLLLSTTGVVDGVIFEPPADEVSERLAALVVAPGLTGREAMNNLRDNVDAVFIPRRIVFVDSLPRSETGKLPRDKILTCYNNARDSDLASTT